MQGHNLTSVWQCSSYRLKTKKSFFVFFLQTKKYTVHQFATEMLLNHKIMNYGNLSQGAWIKYTTVNVLKCKNI